LVLFNAYLNKANDNFEILLTYKEYLCPERYVDSGVRKIRHFSATIF
jgi:hypothetical protein